MKKDKVDKYIKEGSNEDKKTLGDLIDDIYDKINFLKDEIKDLKDNSIKLTLQGNKIFQLLNDDDTGEITLSKVEKLKDFNKDFYIESLISFISKDKDFDDLQKILDKYEKDISIDQHGES